MMKLEYSRQAVRDLRGIEKKAAKEIRGYMEQYATNPSSLPPKKIKNLVGNLHGYKRLRVGDYRALFIDNGESVAVVRIRHRKEIYD